MVYSSFCDNGDPVGSSQNQEGKIYLNTQSWAILSGIAPPERAIQCLDSVSQLLDTEYGVMLFRAPVHAVLPRVGWHIHLPPMPQRERGNFLPFQSVGHHC